jgi:hypothetical protein
MVAAQAQCLSGVSRSFKDSILQLSYATDLAENSPDMSGADLLVQQHASDARRPPTGPDVESQWRNGSLCGTSPCLHR